MVKNKKNLIFPYWILGIFLSLIIILIINLLINIILEFIYTSNPDPNADSIALFFYPLYLIVPIILIISIIISVRKSEKTTHQFNKKLIIIILIFIILFFVLNYFFRFSTLVTNEKNIGSCLKNENNDGKESCIIKICDNSKNNSDECYYNNALKSNIPDICNKINSKKNKCTCFYELSKTGAKYDLYDFIKNNGDCNVYSNINELNIACFAIVKNDKSYCNPFGD